MSTKRLLALCAIALTVTLLGAGPALGQGDGAPQEAGIGNSWYMAEGSTASGMETWLLLENPWTDMDANVQISFVTEEGPAGDPLQLVLPTSTRMSINVGAYIVHDQVAATVSTTTVRPIYVERAMYGTPEGQESRAWGTASMGAPYPTNKWYFAEGCTAGGMETWLLVFNPTPFDAVIDIDFMTGEGPAAGLKDQHIPANTRRTFDLGKEISTYELAVVVTATSNAVACERTMFGDGRTWATTSVGTPMIDTTWNFAEGCTEGGMETWLLVANPGDSAVQFGVDFYSDGAVTTGPAAVDLPAHTRRNVNVGEWIQSFEVSSIVTATGPVVCERSMYGTPEGEASRAWAATTVVFGSLTTDVWQFPEGCTEGGMETWLIAFNPTDTDDSFSVTLMDASGVPIPGPQDVPVPAKGRVTLPLNNYLTDFNAAFEVWSANGNITCERTMFGNGRTWATNSGGIPGFK